ncbi:phage tail protein, partial [Escherichia coli]|uniref:phage tail protein n=1 Tax=Escherichia coli TaxID=562 RepID=UPI00397DE684
GEEKASAEAAAKSEQSAKQHRDEAQRIVDDLKGSNASTTEKGLVQLCSDTDNDSEELAATPKAVKTVMDETKTKAPLDSPAFTGTPTTPTPPDDAVGLETANAAFVRKLLAALVDSSPEALDTLNELAAALGNDPNFATTVMNALAGKQPLSDVLTTISNLEERADNLLCFNQDGNASLSPLSEKARALLALDTPEAMRTELELKAAATMEAQSDIYDRTAGCLALPGAFGYGHLFSSSEVVYFSAQNGPAEFLKWVFEVTPGRYAVTQYGGSSTSYNPIIAYDMGQPYFRGLVDIDIRYGIGSGGIEAEAGRWITFHGDAEYSGSRSEGPAKYQVVVTKSMHPAKLPEAWSRLFWSRNRLMQLLYAADNTSQRAPQPGSLVLAAYLPDGDSSEVTLLRTQSCPGSRLRQVVFEAEYRTSGFSATTRSFVYGSTLPGTYVALSGGPDVKFYSRGVVSLFVRVA